MLRIGSLAVVVASLLACGGEGGGAADGGGGPSGDGPLPGGYRLGFPTAASFYHGVFPPSGATEDDVDEGDVATYEAAVGRTVAWVTLSSDWSVDAAFPTATAAWIEARGALPWIRLMLRSSAAPATAADPLYTLEAIAAGDFDDALAAWADGARDHAGPLVVEWGTEANLDRHPWNARWNGDAAGGAAFVAAYRHVHDVVTARAPNVTFAWHVAARGAPVETWNEVEAYFPGSDVVGWMAISVFGGESPDAESYPSLRGQLDAMAPRLEDLAPARPLMIAEMGASAGHATGDPVAWASQAIEDLIDVRWPIVRGFAWRDDDDAATGGDMRLVAIDGLGDAIRLRIEASTAIYDRPILY